MNTIDCVFELKNVITKLISGVDNQEVVSYEPVYGGGNNRSYKVVTKDNLYFLKHYFRDSIDTRNRLKTEYSFTSFAWELGIRCIAQPIAFDEKNSLGAYRYIDGRKLATNEIGKKEIKSALEFLTILNDNKFSTEANLLPLASEACFSIKDHINLVDTRLNRLLEINGNPMDEEASYFVNKELLPEWVKIKNSILLETAEILNDDLESSDRVLSPSDFGFHNALLNPKNQLNFFDFEYAGWDDPAKLVCDFFSQPAIPVSMEYFEEFSDAITKFTSDPRATQSRIRVLLPLIKIKWCCISLNCFAPFDKMRKVFASTITDEYRNEQLKKARKILYAIH